ncbi:MAG: hypothetical protein KGJ23_02780 [Euryarchaeota archaeon]|nr:hypothetical protein [Euryarchaeota archaeon]MDE1835523.1 hypothetical protein [Euryarchaeota archaeon]MDE1879614.1 hypothetical protein [Euryarchaeota archaeon]MDE2043855.1 hypothetical protein [Thermoplasmata archaeon]
MAKLVACTCRALPHCPNCNAQVRVPFSNMDRGAALTSLLRKLEKKERSVPRESLNRLAEGKASCPSCGETIQAMHDRPCVGENLASLGVSMSDREKLLARMSFPE